MLSGSAHILARLQRCSQTRRVIDTKLHKQFSRIITLWKAGKFDAAEEVAKELTAHLEQQKELGRTNDEAISALNRAMRAELTKRAKDDISITVTVKGGTPAQKAEIADQVARSVQKAAKARVTPFLTNLLSGKATAAVAPTAALAAVLALGGLSTHAASIAAGYQCVKYSSVHCHRKPLFPVPFRR